MNRSRDTDHLLYQLLIDQTVKDLDLQKVIHHSGPANTRTEFIECEKIICDDLNASTSWVQLFSN